MTVSLGAIWVHFDQPAWLLAGWIALAPAALALWNRRRGLKLARFGVFLQSLALLLAAVSLAGPVVPFSIRTPRWLILRDVSASVGEQEAGTPNLPTDVEYERQSFAGRVLGEDERDALDATNLRPALEWSAAAIQAGRVDGAILLTDGQFQDDWQTAARNFAKTRAPLWIVPLNAPPRDARIETITAQRRPSHESLRLVASYDIGITVSANAPMRRTITLFRLTPGQAKRNINQSEIVLEPNRPATIHFRDILPSDSAGIWQAELTPRDALPQNDTYQAALLPTKTRVAWVASRSAATIQDVDVVSVPPSDAPTDPTGWLQYNVVVLADATGRLLSAQQRSALAAYVRGGGGLVLLGAGPHEIPADRNDPLNLVLPLRADPFERNPLNLTVVLDASGSMAETTDSPARTKWSLANQAMLALREHLTPTDRLRVIVFSDAARTIYDSSPAGPDFPALGDALRGVHPSGSTNIAPAMERSLGLRPKRGLDVPSKRPTGVSPVIFDQKQSQKQGQDVPATLGQDAQATRTNLVLVLSDLQTAKFDSSTMAKRFEEQGRRLAVVATGSNDGEKTPLAQLAEQLHAPLVYREHLQGLADVFGQLCRHARGETIRRGEYSTRYDSAWPAAARVRRLGAYITAAPRGEVRVDARIERTGDPILALGLAGLGKAAVLSAPPEAILHQPGGDELIAELIRRTTRPGDDPRFDVQTTRNGNALPIRVTVRDGEQAVNNLSPRAEVLVLSNPFAKPISAQCLQSAPGVYEAIIPSVAGRRGALAVRVQDNVDGRLCWQGVAPATYPAEFARLGAEYEQLRELATITGGRIVEPAALSSPARQKELRRPRRSGRAVWRITLTGAIAAMLLAWLGGSFKRKKNAK